MSTSPYSVLQAKLQAWLVTLLTVVVEAYELGAVIGKGARVIAGDDVLTPDVIYVPNSQRKAVKADAIYGPPALAIDVLHSGVSEDERAALRRRYAAARVLEYWQIEADKGRGFCYQADAEWNYDLIPPDKGGLHYSAAIVQLAFPVEWFRKQPGLLKLMEWWGIVEVEE
ncbi:MAG: Uma2 family endonuclease [Thermoflexales bacterium]|nr:Uma2 family endonuclease [Thermoflexales bacterium]MDW8352482.1 Uma2 family endonuclease [Anaerolineae bacterium]